MLPEESLSRQRESWSIACQRANSLRSALPSSGQGGLGTHSSSEIDSMWLFFPSDLVLISQEIWAVYVLKIQSVQKVYGFVFSRCISHTASPLRKQRAYPRSLTFASENPLLPLWKKESQYPPFWVRIFGVSLRGHLDVLVAPVHCMGWEKPLYVTGTGTR